MGLNIDFHWTKKHHGEYGQIGWLVWRRRRSWSGPYREWTSEVVREMWEIHANLMSSLALRLFMRVQALFYVKQGSWTLSGGDLSEFSHARQTYSHVHMRKETFTRVLNPWNDIGIWTARSRKEMIDMKTNLLDGDRFGQMNSERNLKLETGLNSNMSRRRWVLEATTRSFFLNHIQASCLAWREGLSRPLLISQIDKSQKRKEKKDEERKAPPATYLHIEGTLDDPDGPRRLSIIQIFAFSKRAPPKSREKNSSLIPKPLRQSPFGGRQNVFVGTDIGSFEILNVLELGLVFSWVKVWKRKRLGPPPPKKKEFWSNVSVWWISFSYHTASESFH